jgi:DNA polymerase
MTSPRFCSIGRLAASRTTVTDPRTLLAAHLRQLAELGGRDLFLDDVSAAAFARAVRAWPPAQAGSAGADERAATRTVAGPQSAPTARAYSPAAVAEALPVLAAEAQGCTRCRLHEGRRTVVFGEGNPAADVVVVGEAPGQEEDRTGRPFVGRAGKLLDLLLMSAGFPRAEVYICNVLKCRPPDNRNPLPDEVEVCTTRFLRPQLEAIRPRVLLAVGRFAVQALLGTDAAIARLRGRIHDFRGTPLVVSYHPAFLLRSPHMMRAAWQDLQLLRTVLDEQA